MDTPELKLARGFPRPLSKQFADVDERDYADLMKNGPGVRDYLLVMEAEMRIFNRIRNLRATLKDIMPVLKMAREDNNESIPKSGKLDELVRSVMEGQIAIWERTKKAVGSQDTGNIMVRRLIMADISGKCREVESRIPQTVRETQKTTTSTNVNQFDARFRSMGLVFGLETKTERSRFPHIIHSDELALVRDQNAGLMIQRRRSVEADNFISKGPTRMAWDTGKKFPTDRPEELDLRVEGPGHKHRQSPSTLMESEADTGKLTGILALDHKGMLHSSRAELQLPDRHSSLYLSAVLTLQALKKVLDEINAEHSV